MRTGPDQKFPHWGWAHLDERLVEAADTSARHWRQAIRCDPCAYCGGSGGEADHIRAQVRGGTHTWHNLTGACRRCNVAKSCQTLLQFLVGQQHTGLALCTGTAQLDDLLVAVADLRAVPWGRQRPGGFRETLIRQMLDDHAEADGALVYGRRQRSADGTARYIHILPTRRADAGAICRLRGGGGTARRGAFTAAKIAVRP